MYHVLQNREAADTGLKSEFTKAPVTAECDRCPAYLDQAFGVRVTLNSGDRFQEARAVHILRGFRIVETLCASCADRAGFVSTVL